MPVQRSVRDPSCFQKQGIRSLRILAACALLVGVFSLLQSRPLFAQSGVSANTAQSSLANAFAGLIEQAIPRQYEKKKDWDKTKRITVGIKNDGWKLSRRKKTVKHGVWKHYKVELVNPDENFEVLIENLHLVNAGRVGFTLRIRAELGTWMRAKIYQYGIHIIALEILGSTKMDLAMDCEIGASIETNPQQLGITIDPSVTSAKLNLIGMKIDRISNAEGPIVKSLGETIEPVLEKELNGPKLVAKLNRAIDKKRNRLRFRFEDLMDSAWWPLAELPAIQESRSLVR